MRRQIATCFLFLSTTAGAAQPADAPADKLVEGRAIQAVIWGMPAVNYDLMLQQMLAKVGGRENEIVYWSRLPTWKNQTLTPNPDAVYSMAFFNTRDVGPVVLDIPPADNGSITGNIDNAWQVALEDAGPAGADKGAGGKYLILPPGFTGTLPDGYIPLRSDTYGGYALLRSTPKSGSDSDVENAVAYVRRVRLYPLSQAANPPETRFVDAIDVLYDSTIPYDLNYFEALNRVIQREPWLDRDRVMIDSLRSIGIEKGKPFHPDEKTRALLVKAAKEAHAVLDQRYETAFPPYVEGHQWSVPASPAAIAGQSTNFGKPDVYPVDDRALTYSFGFVGIKNLGGGQFYLITSKDHAGHRLDGSRTYRLTVPANVPVGQYWSATVYDRSTHAFIRGATRFSRSSQNPDLKTNPDGSVDVYFGPKPPSGQEHNWIPTSAGGGFEVLFRFYSPRRPLMDKTWVLPDIVRQ